ncbi:YtxH domain-containing protein [Flavobacterium agricola]|uniref:YtxH domain-containing protein n=1 Tax=Flavobacterium agricola TaxID=2870839 RepID=A0ABY6LYB8_9FLAO|nr:YtxH domain-containing protein [Flavobacterium agricola]UYW00977.1 YtxH domain-containing protein [Flavobacterium agricola]
MANKNLSNGLIAILAGVGVGALVGVLFAPEKGSITRKRIKDEVENEADELKKKFKSLKRKALKEKKEKEVVFEEKFNALIEKADHKKDDVIAALEKKLNELKELKSKSLPK